MVPDFILFGCAIFEIFGRAIFGFEQDMSEWYMYISEKRENIFLAYLDDIHQKGKITYSYLRLFEFTCGI